MDTTQVISLHVGGGTIVLPESTIVKNYLDSLQHHAAISAELQASLSAGVPEVGEYWPEQGGIYAGIMRGDPDGPRYHLIVSPQHKGEAEDLKWGPYPHEFDGAKSPWDGLANTRAMVAAEQTYPAAEWAHRLELNGFNDWYLPARREASLCAATVPEIFSKGWHWTSTRYSAHDAFIQYFSDGFQSFARKVPEHRARAVRRLLID